MSGWVLAVLALRVSVGELASRVKDLGCHWGLIGVESLGFKFEVGGCRVKGVCCRLSLRIEGLGRSITG